MRKNKILNDLFLVLGFICLTLIIYIIFKLNLKEGTLVKISVDSEIKYCYNLNEVTEVIIKEGKNSNTLVIKGRKAQISNANCPDKICVAHKPISKTGETIVCLPHKLVVEITEE